MMTELKHLIWNGDVAGMRRILRNTPALANQDLEAQQLETTTPMFHNTQHHNIGANRTKSIPIQSAFQVLIYFIFLEFDLNFLCSSV
eukprot:c20749_g1_i25.p1 GENE.c20749_g1_i25~~c20749_g1_i25.p1  ORF type:complete len:102 (+),score=29.07 c20749_g1_i25:46-306(+)